MKKPSLPTHPPFSLLQCKWRHSITYTYISSTFKPFLLGAWKMIKVSYYKIQILTFKFYYKHTTKKKLPACTHAYIYQGPRRGGAEGDLSPPARHLPNTFSDGKVIFFFFDFGYPDLSLTTQTRFSTGNLTILNTHKQRTDKLCLVGVTNEFLALNDNWKGNFGTFRKSDSKMSGWHSTLACVRLASKSFSFKFCSNVGARL